MPNSRRPPTSRTTVCTVTVRKTEANLPPRIVPVDVGVVIMRGRVPSWSSVRIVRATLEAPKNMKKIIMPARIRPMVEVSSPSSSSGAGRPVGEDEGLVRAAVLHEGGGRGLRGVVVAGGAAGHGRRDRRGRPRPVEVEQRLGHDRLGDGGAELLRRVHVQLDRGLSRPRRRRARR